MTPKLAEKPAETAETTSSSGCGCSTSAADTNAENQTTSVEIPSSDSSSEELPSHDVKLSDAAADKVRTLLHQEGREDLRLRIAVQPGGCSGLIYQLYFDERVLDGDAVADFDGVEVIIDQMSVPYLMDAVIDFEDTISKQGFTIDNPNASGSCACGDSFH